MQMLHFPLKLCHSALVAKFGHKVVATLPGIVQMESLTRIELVSSSARVTSFKSQKVADEERD